MFSGSIPSRCRDKARATTPSPASYIASSSGRHLSNLSGVTSNGYHSSIDEDDIVIGVMGLTGAGKSSFVNKVAGRKETAIGDGLISQTRAVQPVRCPHPDGRRTIVLVDTPGFDDTTLTDAQILKIIANWLKNTYQNNIKLAGILYLHRISDVRMAGTPLRNLHVFRDLCGDENFKNVVLVTTMWDEIEDQAIGSKREEELLLTFWKGMTDLGSRTRRFEGTPKSAWEIIDCLDLGGCRQRLTPLQIQREMVDGKLPLHQTTAAKTLRHYFVQLTKDFKRVWEKMRNRAHRAVPPRTPTSGHWRNVVLTRSSTIRSSGTGSSLVPSTDTASFSTYESGYPLSPTETVPPGCSAAGRQDALLATITGLRFAYQVADLASAPTLRGTIGTVLHIAQLIEGMGGTHHAISQVVENSGWLLEEITQHVAKTSLSKDMGRTLRSFQRELNNLQRAVIRIGKMEPIARFFLHDADIQTITACTTLIKAVYDKPEVRISPIPGPTFADDVRRVKLATDNRQAIARLEDHLTTLRNNATPRQCECGRSVISEEPQENRQ